MIHSALGLETVTDFERSVDQFAILRALRKSFPGIGAHIIDQSEEASIFTLEG